MLKIGDQIEDFTLPDQNNKNISLRDYKEEWIVVYFYPKDNTPGCTIEACDFSENFEDLDAVILGVSPDTPRKHSNFIKKYSLKITLLADVEKELCQKFNLWKQKKFMGREYMGVERTTFLISPNGKLAFKWENVKVKGHVDEVKIKLEELKELYKNK